MSKMKITARSTVLGLVGAVTEEVSNQPLGSPDRQVADRDVDGTRPPGGPSSPSTSTSTSRRYIVYIVTLALRASRQTHVPRY